MKKFLLSIILISITGCNLSDRRVTATPTPLPTESVAPKTVTPAPSPIPSPTVTSVPTPVPTFFTDEFNGDLGAWTFFQTGGEQEGESVLLSDALNLRMSAPHTWRYAIHSAHEYAGVFISAQVNGEPSGSLGLVCGYSAENGWYEFNVTHEGTYSILKGSWLAEGIAEYRPILNDASEYLQAGNMRYEIGLTCNNDTLFLHINGKMFKKIDVTHIGLPPGKVGIATASFDNAPMNAYFEWFKVGAPEW